MSANRNALSNITVFYRHLRPLKHPPQRPLGFNLTYLRPFSSVGMHCLHRLNHFCMPAYIYPSFNPLLITMQKRNFSLPSENPQGPLDTFINLGYAKKGTNLSDVTDMYKEVLKVQLLTYPVISKEVAKAYADLAISEHQNRDLENACKHYEKAYTLYKQIAGGQITFDVANALSNLGVVHRDVGNLEIAEEYLKESLEMKEKQYANGHITMVDTLNNLGVLFHIKEAYHTAITFYERALKLLLEMGNHSVEEPYTSLVYYNLGSSLYKLKEWKLSIESLEKGYELSKRLFGEGHSNSQRIEVLLNKAIEKNKSVQ